MISIKSSLGLIEEHARRIESEQSDGRREISPFEAAKGVWRVRNISRDDLAISKVRGTAIHMYCVYR